MLAEKSVTMRLSEIFPVSKMCTTGKDFRFSQKTDIKQVNNVN